MQWENPTYLYLLAAIPLWLFFIWWSFRRRKKQVAALGDAHLVQKMMPNYSRWRRALKAMLLVMAFTAMVIALANLRMGSKRETVQANSSEIILCFDVSRSMLAEDVKPDRLTRARILASQIMDALSGNKFGLIVFAGKAYVQMPLTIDTRAAQMYLNAIHTDLVQTQGTALADALQTAEKAFEQGGSESANNQAVIVITDGESHDDGALEAAQSLADKGVRIITIGVGSPQGAPIPENTGANRSFKKDQQGQVVLSKLNEPMLKEMAAIGNGSYLNIQAGRSVLQQVEKEMAALDKVETDTYTFSEYRSHYQLFIWMAFLLLLAEWLIPDKRSAWFRNWLQIKQKEEI